VRFETTPEQDETVRAWTKDHGCNLNGVGAIGGGLSYEFTPASIGVVTLVKCACGNELDLTNYDSW